MNGIILEIKKVVISTFCKLKDFIEKKFDPFVKSTEDNFKDVKNSLTEIKENIQELDVKTEISFEQIQELLLSIDFSDSIGSIKDELEKIREEINNSNNSSDIKDIKDKLTELFTLQEECCDSGSLGEWTNLNT